MRGREHPALSKVLMDDQEMRCALRIAVVKLPCLFYPMFFKGSNIIFHVNLNRDVRRKEK